MEPLLASDEKSARVIKSTHGKSIVFVKQKAQCSEVAQCKSIFLFSSYFVMCFLCIVY